MAWYVYELAPIDFGWERLKSVADVAASLGAEEASQRADHGGPVGVELEVDDFLRDWENAKDLARKKGWEGDFRHPPVVFWIPAESGFVYGFAFKQDNNGDTYVVSPLSLPHLEA